jgi:hypothetical protein
MRRIANVAPWPNVDLYDPSEQVAWANRCHNTLNEFDGVGLRSHVNQRLGLIQARVSDDVQRDEYWQAVDNVTWMAMEALPNGWSGYAYTDSQITIGRFFWGWHVDHNIPAAWSARVGRAITRLGKVTPVLLSGHPTLNDLRARVKVKTGRMVSLHNVWCDAQCSRLGAQMPPDVVRKARLPQEA